MKALLTSLLLFSVSAFAVTENTGRLDNITTNNPAKATIDLKKNVDIQSTGGLYLPKGTTAQRISPTKDGLLRYNSTTGTAELYANSAWSPVGGILSAWITAKAYSIGDIVIQSNKIYKCLVDHTSGTFSTDLTSADWVEVSQGILDHTNLTSIGTNTHTQIDTALTRLANTSGTNTGDQTNISGNAATVTTNANLTGDITSSGNATTIGALKVTNGMLAGAIDLYTKVTGTLPLLNGGTGSSTQNFVDLTQVQTVAGVKTFSSTIVGSVNGNSATTTTIPSLSGDVTNTGNAVSISNAPVIAKVLTGFTSGAGTVSASDSILSATQKLNGNIALAPQLAQVNNYTKQNYVTTYTYATGATVDFDNGNGVSLTAPSTTAITLNNIADGGSYNLLITDGIARTYAFTANKREAGSLTVRCSPALAATTSGKHALFNFLRMGSYLYCTWIGDL